MISVKEKKNGISIPLHQHLTEGVIAYRAPKRQDRDLK